MPKNKLLENMNIEERIELNLRNLYGTYGYKRFKMGKFEDYDLYTNARDFIPTEDIITISGQRGKLLALRPDLTLSIVKYFRDEDKPLEKLFYSENIYRAGKDGSYKELKQIGLECLGKINDEEVGAVALLAALSLKTISPDFIMEISHMGFLQEFISDIPEGGKKLVLKAISEKNVSLMDEIGVEFGLSEETCFRVKSLIGIYGDYKSALPKLFELADSENSIDYLKEIEGVCKFLNSKGLGAGINIDFSIVNNMTYYSGILFRGYVPGIYKGILSGGQYDGLMSRMRKKGSALGFAIYLDELADFVNFDEGRSHTKNVPFLKDDYINIALPKGRLGNRVYDLFEKAGYPCKEIKDDNRKLVFENRKKKIRYFLVKPSDVSVYVERGTADIGVCGSDILKEYNSDVYEVLDLKRGKCQMVVAGSGDFTEDTSRTLRVATKFPRIAGDFFEKESRNIEIIKLHGSIELAPVLGMSDVIVDIVETGKTLKENNLKILEQVLKISSRLIVNKSTFKFKNERIVKLIKDIESKV